MFGSLDEDVYIIRVKPYKVRPSMSLFLVTSIYKEEIMLEKFIKDLKEPKNGVINANILSYDFEFTEETTFDGIKCHLYMSKCGDVLYVHKQDIFSYGTYYLGGSL